MPSRRTGIRPESSRPPRAATLAALTMAVLVAVTALLALGAPCARADKNYWIEQVTISAQLQDDGSMDVTESRTYRFRDSYRYAYRRLPLGEVSYEDITLGEEGRPYRCVSAPAGVVARDPAPAGIAPQDPAPPADKKEPGTFRVTEADGHLEVRWFFRARDERRTFDLHYRVADLVPRHEDAALLYFKFIGEDWSKSSRNVRLRVAPPQALAAANVQAWLHGPLWAELAIRDDGSVDAWCERLPARTRLEVRALYPPSLFAGAAERGGQIRAAVLEEEARWAGEANQRRAEARAKWARRQANQATGARVMPFAALAGLVAGVVLFFRFRIRPDVPPAPPMSGAPPSRTPPALVGYLLRGRQTNVQDLIATLMDLARRGFLILREEQREKKPPALRIFGGGDPALPRLETHHVWELKRDRYQRERAELLPYEARLLDFLFQDLSGGADTIDLATLRKESRAVTRFFRDWRREVGQAAKERQYYNPETLRGMTIVILLAVALIVAGAALGFAFALWSLALAGSGLIVLVLAFFIPQRTPQGEMEAQGWRALGRYLKAARFGSSGPGALSGAGLAETGLAGAASTGTRLAGAGRSGTERSGSSLSGERDLLANIDVYLVYALVLGLSAKLYKRLAASVPQDQAHVYFPWYAGAWSGGDGLSEGFGGAFSSMVATATSAVSSAAGTGGGASGGGGGGAGGGGGGAG